VKRREIVTLAGAGLAFQAASAQQPRGNAAPAESLDVRNFGAKGDGTMLDTIAINRAIDAAAAAGGGTVFFPAGTYASYSIHLKSKVSLYLGPGATILAAENTSTTGYDAAEPMALDKYQDYGHSHFHNSLIWGEDLTDIAILGPGLIYGKGLSKGTGPGLRAEIRTSATNPSA
jgi:polygalacturonase